MRCEEWPRAKIGDVSSRAVVVVEHYKILEEQE